MSPLDAAWAFLWGVLLWAFFVLACVGAVILIFAIVVGIIQSLPRLFKPFKRQNQGQHRAE